MKHSRILSRDRGGKKHYYCNVRGQQYGLGSDIDEARERFAQLLGRSEPEKKIKSKTIGELAVLFDRWLAEFSAPPTRETHMSFITRWIAHVGPNTRAADIKARHIDSFVMANKYQGRWSHASTVRSVSRLFNWAKKQGYLPEAIPNPARGCENVVKPASPEIIFTNKQIAFLMRTRRNKTFRDAVRFMIATGCRVEEIRKARVEHVNLKERTVILPWTVAKLGKRTHQDRVIRYPAKLDRFMRRRVAGKQHGSPLFPNNVGNPIDTGSFNETFRVQIRKSKGLIPKGSRGTCLRYTFTTRAILRGVGPVELAKLLGHTDLKMLMKHYQKLGVETDHMRRALDLALDRSR